jgi:hypothetical protein
MFMLDPGGLTALGLAAGLARGLGDLGGAAGLAIAALGLAAGRAADALLRFPQGEHGRLTTLNLLELLGLLKPDLWLGAALAATPDLRGAGLTFILGTGLETGLLLLDVI